MKLTFLGTAGPDQIPSPYCDCSRCEHARTHGGHDKRKRCSYLINDDMLVDMGADLMVACSMHNVHLMNLKYALVTHSHHDHFYPQNLSLRRLGFQESEMPTLTFAAPPSTMMLLDMAGVRDERIALKRRPVLPFDRLELPPYQITALKAAHMQAVGDAVNYLIDDGQKKVLIASDTAVYEEDVWPYLEGAKLDQLIIECAVGVNTSFAAGQTRHLSINGVSTMLERMRAIEAITPDTPVYATHFTHKHCLTHEEMSEVFKELGVVCAYDGLVLDF